MKVLRGRRAVPDADVLLRGELKEALEPRARMLGAVAFVPVRQQQREPRGLAPLREARGDELVDHDLRAVHEVPELRLPEHECLRRRRRVAVLEAHTGVLRERRVMDLERRRRLVEMLQGRERRPGLDVVQDGVTMRERAALGVLARDPDRDPVDEQRRERERLALPPVDAALLERLPAPLELLHQLRVRREPVGRAQELLVQLAQLVRGDGGHDLACGPGGNAPLVRGPAA